MSSLLIVPSTSLFHSHKVHSQIMFIIRHCIILNISFNNIIILECDICENYFNAV